MKHLEFFVVLLVSILLLGNNLDTMWFNYTTIPNVGEPMLNAFAAGILLMLTLSLCR